MFWLIASKIYDKISALFQIFFKRNLKGIGYLLRKVKIDYVLSVAKQQMFFNHKVAGCYVRLINGKYTEIETHIFLKRILEGINEDINFIDIGANVGEMVLDVATYEKVKFIYAFEPHRECAKACNISVMLNGYDHKVVVKQKVLSKDTSPVKFAFDGISPNASGITVSNGEYGIVTYPSTLDQEFPDALGPSILLIDVEGAEPLVLKGGPYFIEKDLPLIIFEYNDLSKQYFALDDIRSILGVDYSIFRLRGDGYLDRNYINTWNCVAVNTNSIFYEPVKALIAA
jgi:FkbM family methyltransferase